ncbi:MAG TPA: hypothetical protein VHX66_13420 [Solirubrobacteraceae bacterium]|jgi:hypothetical protein|nr:hypothetical protein [Solirubrobacteraceae bacterium]
MSRRIAAATLTTAALAACAATALAAGASPRLLSCSGSPLIKPTGTVVLSCADANSELKSTHWSSWSVSGASGTTDFGLNLCTPDCAASRIRFFADSSVRLLDPKHTAKGLLFTRVVVSYKLNGKQRSFTAYPPTR